MAIIALGINHNSASVALREQLSFPPEQLEHALNEARRYGANEIVIISTCNRSDIFAVMDSEKDWQQLLGWWSDFHRIDKNVITTNCYHMQGEAAIRHLARVASGLDSMVLGEPQILGQVKSAFATAKEYQAIGTELGQLFPFVFTLAKKVRTQTAIGRNPVSVAYTAVTLAKRIFSDLSKCRALLIGAGETSELVCKHLNQQNMGAITVANRSIERAHKLAEKYQAQAVLFSDIPSILERVDIVISSTASHLPILGKGAVESAIKKRKHRPMLMIDLAVPRDIEPEVSQLKDIYLYCVDDLREIIEHNRQDRREQADQAELILQQGMAEFAESQREREALGTLIKFRDKYEGLCEQEVDKAMRQLKKGDPPEFVLLTLARSITQKIIHEPSVQIKRAGAKGDQQRLMWVHELFQLDEENNLGSDD